MAIDLRTEKPVTLRTLGRLLPDKPDYDTVHKWFRRGLKVEGSPKRVKLETIRLTTGRCTSMEAYYRFIAALNAGPDGEGEVPGRMNGSDP